MRVAIYLTFRGAIGNRSGSSSFDRFFRVILRASEADGNHQSTSTLRRALGVGRKNYPTDTRPNMRRSWVVMPYIVSFCIRFAKTTSITRLHRRKKVSQAVRAASGDLNGFQGISQLAVFAPGRPRLFRIQSKKYLQSYTRHHFSGCYTRTS